MHKFKRNCVAHQRARIRQFYQRKHAVQSAQPTQTKKAA